MSTPGGVSGAALVVITVPVLSSVPTRVGTGSKVSGHNSSLGIMEVSIHDSSKIVGWECDHTKADVKVLTPTKSVLVSGVSVSSSVGASILVGHHSVDVVASVALVPVVVNSIEFAAIDE